MSGKVIERVARALCERQARGAITKDWTASLAVTPLEDRVRSAVDRYWPGFVDAARDAIAAMREPTDEMRRALDQKADPRCQDDGSWTSPTDAFRSAIDAALTPTAANQGKDG